MKCRDIGVWGHSPGWDLDTQVLFLFQLPRHLGKSFKHVSLSFSTLKINRFSSSPTVIKFGLMPFLTVSATHLAEGVQTPCQTLKCTLHSRAGGASVPGISTSSGFLGGSGLPVPL